MLINFHFYFFRPFIRTYPCVRPLSVRARVRLVRALIGAKRLAEARTEFDVAKRMVNEQAAASAGHETGSKSAVGAGGLGGSGSSWSDVDADLERDLGRAEREKLQVLHNRCEN
jgi:hypothetical protein